MIEQIPVGARGSDFRRSGSLFPSVRADERLFAKPSAYPPEPLTLGFQASMQRVQGVQSVVENALLRELGPGGEEFAFAQEDELLCGANPLFHLTAIHFKEGRHVSLVPRLRAVESTLRCGLRLRLTSGMKWGV